MKRKCRPNFRLVKIHRNYTVEEAALLLGLHKNTMRIWIKKGLPVCDDQRPLLILGGELVVFLKSQRVQKKSPCAAGEIYCVRCRTPRTPAGQIADFMLRTGLLGDLVGICPICDAMMYRRASIAKLSLIRGELEITVVQARRRISESY